MCAKTVTVLWALCGTHWSCADRLTLGALFMLTLHGWANYYAFRRLTMAIATLHIEPSTFCFAVWRFTDRRTHLITTGVACPAAFRVATLWHKLWIRIELGPLLSVVCEEI